MTQKQPSNISKSYTIGDVNNAMVNQGENIQVEVTHSFINETEKKSLNEAVTKIEQLVKQLSQTYPSQTTTEQMTIATQVINKIENTPNWKQKAIQAFRGGLLETLKTNPVGAFVVGAIEGWSQK